MSEEIKEVKKRGRKKKSEGNTEEIENIVEETRILSYVIYNS